MEEKQETIEIKTGLVFYHKVIGRRIPNKHYIVAILDQEPEIQIVHKYYKKHKQYWQYKVESEWAVIDQFKTGSYFMTRKEAEKKWRERNDRLESQI